MKTKEVVALMNISQDTLRYYEKVGVIPPVNRDENGYRIYNDSDLNWIYLVKICEMQASVLNRLSNFAG
ncbi:HTH-type transcriptional regulator AdhR [Staphylococcus aureus]|nr:HTH-type transcriptional regulator AdhR [Staphylococcus aureus]